MRARRRGRRFSPAVAAFLGVAVLVFAGSAAHSRAIHVRTADGRQMQVETRILGGLEYLACPHVARILNGEFAYEGGVRRGRCKVGGHEFVIVSGNPFVAVDGAARQVQITPLTFGGILWVPVDVLGSIFSEPLGLSVQWDRGAARIHIRKSGAAIQDIRMRRVVPGRETVVTIGTSVPVLPVTRREGRRIILSFPRTQLVHGPVSRASPDGLIDRIEWAVRGGHAVIILTLSDRAGAATVSRRREPSEVFITILASAGGVRGDSRPESSRGQSVQSSAVDERPAGGPVAGTEPGGGALPAVVDVPSSYVPVPTIRLPTIPRGQWTIVIDPGHGGKDPGAVGPTGLYEKQVNLSIARHLARALRERVAVQVILTREDDTFIPLGRRTEIANQVGAQAFISIHCNAAGNGNARGAETYFLSVANTDEERAVAARENASLLFEESERDGGSLDELSFILLDLAQNEFLEESSELAELIQAELGVRAKSRDRGIHQAGFFVLNGAYMPGVLIEAGFISNREEERLLRSDRHCSEIADAICRGVEEFVRRYERKLNG